MGEKMEPPHQGLGNEVDTSWQVPEVWRTQTGKSSFQWEEEEAGEGGAWLQGQELWF
jgi:hypothetical protein